MGAAAPARKAAAAAPARRKKSSQRAAGGRTSHSALRQKPKRSPRTAGGARNAVRATPARRRPQRSGHFVPYAVGRTAGAVRHLPDTGVVFRLTRGRAWIGLLSLLLTGIVALNVVSLSLSAAQGKLSQQAMIVEQENTALHARLAERLSSGRIRHSAASIGMTAPKTSDVSYRDASRDAVRAAARRLAEGFGLGGSMVSAPTTSAATAPSSLPGAAPSG